LILLKAILPKRQSCNGGKNRKVWPECIWTSSAMGYSKVLIFSAFFWIL